ncbi:MAG: GIY-YIG nuclease family protein [Bacillota bacterium]|nr:GIY-YIG nuclease family protein [Bacillota bacterium]
MKTPASSTADAPVTGRPCVYILECCDGTLYTGWTNDFEKRLATHNRGKGGKYTRGRTPVTPVYLEYLPDKVAATRREAAIKKLPLPKKRQLIESETNQLK